MNDQNRPTTEDPNPPTAPADTPRTTPRRYASPVLTEYGCVDDLVDSGVVGNGTSVG